MTSVPDQTTFARSFVARSSTIGSMAALLYKITLTSLAVLILALSQASTPSYAEPAISDGLRESYEQQRRDVAERMEKATVFVIVTGDDEGGMGSGFVVADGYIMTNAHVVNSAKRPKIYIINSVLPLTETTVVNQIYERDSGPHGRDFALLRFTPPPGLKLPVLTLSTDLRKTDRVSAWGYPGMITQFDKSMIALEEDDAELTPPPLVYTEGTVSAFVDYQGVSIIHTAPIAGGNSGGPLVNRKGAVVGINTWGYTEDDEGAFINGALPAQNIIDFLRQNNVNPLVDAGQDRLTASATTDPHQDASEARTSQSGSSQPAGMIPTPSRGQESDPRLNSAEARENLRLAMSGDPDHMAAVGAMYLDGSDGFPLDHNRALYWIELAAQAGNMYGLAMLGMLHLLDDDIRDPARGLDLLRQSAAKPDSDPDVQAFLATVLFEGESLGVPTDYEESFQWAEKAAQGGSATGQAVLGFHYMEGLAVKEDEAKAAALARAAVAQGDAKGKALLAYLGYVGADYSRDPDQVIALAEEAAQEDEAQAQGLLAVIYAFDPDRSDEIKAEKWARLAASQANPMGQYVLGWLYMTGRVVDKNKAMAWAYLDLADQKMVDLEVDEAGPLLKQLEQGLGPQDKKQGRKIQLEWRKDWGFNS